MSDATISSGLSIEEFPECDQFVSGRKYAICRGEVLTPAACDVYRVQWGLSRRFTNAANATSTADGSQEKTQKRGCGKKDLLSLFPEGAGTELLEIFHAAGVPACQACRDLAGRMNQWGPVECRNRLDQIVAEIFPRAKEWVAQNMKWTHALLPGCVEDIGIRMRVRGYVVDSIERFETKQCLADAQ